MISSVTYRFLLFVDLFAILSSVFCTDALSDSVAVAFVYKPLLFKTVQLFLTFPTCFQHTCNFRFCRHRIWKVNLFIIKIVHWVQHKKGREIKLKERQTEQICNIITQNKYTL